MVSVGFGKTRNGGFAEALLYGADNGAQISSNSWGYTNPGAYSQSVLNAIDYYNAKSGIVVFAAGNSNSESAYYPGYYEGAVAVAAVKNSGVRADFSNYGDWIEIAAPGVSVYSTLTGSTYGYASGTSMAAPHVAGMLALGMAVDITFPRDGLLSCAYDTAMPIDDLNPDYEEKLAPTAAPTAVATDPPRDDPPRDDPPRDDPPRDDPPREALPTRPRARTGATTTTFFGASYSYSFDFDDDWLKPTARPTAVVTDAPTVAPSVKPTAKPSSTPVRQADHARARAPSPAPTAKPTSKPTAAPTSKLTLAPTPAPSPEPTSKPIAPKPASRPATDWSTPDDDVFSYSYSYGGHDWDDDWVGTKCACSAFYNGADAEDEFLCVKKSNGVLADDDAADAASDADTRDPLLGAAATDEDAVAVARAVDARARTTRIVTNTTEATT
ncbi:serine-type endopeptidase [Aureococcus anophagefferens]|uniref:subtilisin n=1 Tax=Aureococcus anophagefferens TaxID=44056 RepID=A0ABR1FGC4_AURAN